MIIVKIMNIKILENKITIMKIKILITKTTKIINIMKK